jgi:SAM-dependent methyltransferase
VKEAPKSRAREAVERAGSAPEEAERFAPDAHGPLLAYEHVHRYALAATLLKGRRVLDLASGTGYGTRILRSAGADVVALDLDADCARAAGSPSLCGRAELEPFGDGSFDAVVCFEAIEHVPEPSRVLDEIVRVLRPSGVALLSTPDRALYTERAGQRNPHHLAELDCAEFAALLRERFPHVALYGQSVWAGSWLRRLDETGAPQAIGARKLQVLPDPLATGAAVRRSPPWVDPTEDLFPTPLFLVAVCARDAAGSRRMRRSLPAQSVLHDPAQWLLGHYLAALGDVVARDREVECFAAHARDLQVLVAEREERVGKLEHHARNLETLLREREERVAGLEAHARDLDQLSTGVQAHARNLEALLRERDEHLAGVELRGRDLACELAALRANPWYRVLRRLRLVERGRS